MLQDVLSANNPRITVKDIQREVAEHFAVRLSDMLSTKRTRVLVRPRKIAMYLAKQSGRNRVEVK